MQNVHLIREFCRVRTALQQAQQRACNMLLNMAQIEYARIWNAAGSTEQQTFFRSLRVAEYAAADWHMDITGTCLRLTRVRPFTEEMNMIWQLHKCFWHQQCNATAVVRHRLIMPARR